MSFRIETHEVATADGWHLRLERGVGEAGPRGTPVVFIPGYGMNAWIFRYHPTAASFLEVLLQAGLDPWAVDLRGTSTSSAGPGAPPATLSGQALVDLPAVLAHICARSGAERVHAIGCSLGGSLLYAYAIQPDHVLDRVVCVGAPLDWGVGLRTRLLGRVLPVVGRVPLRGTRRFASVGLPLLAAAVPRALQIYLNPKITDVREARDLVLTVEDPVPSVNLAIGAWMRAGALHIGGVHVRAELHRFTRPLLVLHASGDGIVPEESALSVVGATGGPVEVQQVDHPSGEPVGHADLFASDIAPERVFAVTAAFLTGG